MLRCLWPRNDLILAPRLALSYWKSNAYGKFSIFDGFLVKWESEERAYDEKFEGKWKSFSLIFHLNSYELHENSNKNY